MLNDVDPVETREWLDALGSVLAFEGTERARFLLGELATEGRRRGAPAPYSATTPYLNTIPVDQQPAYPGDLALEHEIRSMTHPLYLRPLVNRNPAETNRTYAPGHALMVTARKVAATAARNCSNRSRTARTASARTSARYVVAWPLPHEEVIDRPRMATFMT